MVVLFYSAGKHTTPFHSYDVYIIKGFYELSNDALSQWILLSCESMHRLHIDRSLVRDKKIFQALRAHAGNLMALQKEGH